MCSLYIHFHKRCFFFLSSMDVEFYWILFLWFISVPLLMWLSTLFDLHNVEPFLWPRDKSNWSWYMIFLCGFGFGLLIFSWEFLHIYIHQRFWHCLCLVLVSGWWRLLRMSLEVSLSLQSFGRAWEGSV